MLSSARLFALFALVARVVSVSAQSEKPKTGCWLLMGLDATNNSVLTTSLNAAWNGWSRADKANFAAYKKRIENVAYNRSLDGVPKLSQIAKIFDEYAPDGSIAKDLILGIILTDWGNVCEYLNCAIHYGYYTGASEKNCTKFPTTTKPEPVAQFCPAGWSYFAYTNSCYLLNRDVPIGGFEAQEKACQAMGAQLMSIHRIAEQTLVLALMATRYVVNAWIGMRSPTSNATYAWTDGTPNDFSYWADGFPNATATHHCVKVTTTAQMKIALWQNSDCGGSSCPPTCEPGWSAYSEGSPPTRYCAKYVSWNVTYDEALAKCQELGAKLPTVRSAKENEFVLKLATASASDPVWLGLHQDPDTFAWSWPDGSDGWAAYSHWASENPVNRNPPATCVNLYPSLDGDSTGLWKNEYCRCANCWAGAICVRPSAA